MVNFLHELFQIPIYTIIKQVRHMYIYIYSKSHNTVLVIQLSIYQLIRFHK